MSEVSIDINGRKYRMACEDGQEQHLIELGKRLNQFVDKFKEGFGEIGDNRLTVMAGIAVTDSLVEAEKNLKSINERYVQISEENTELLKAREDEKLDFVQKLSDMASKIEALTSSLEGKG